MPGLVDSLSPHGTFELWSSKFAITELGQEVTLTDIAQDHDTCLTFAKAVTFPSDVNDLATEEKKVTANL